MPDEQPDCNLVRIAVLEAQLDWLKENIKMQALEYERRLAELNHSHQQQMARNIDYVSRNVWDLKLKEFDEWRRTIDQWRWISIGAGGVSGGLLGALISRIVGG